jgi:uncharacterized protein
MTGLSIIAVINMIFLAFVCEYMDSTLGMGYGTTLTPILLIMGYKTLQVVPVILISELLSGGLAVYCHHHEGNINMRPKTFNMLVIVHKIKLYGFRYCFSKGLRSCSLFVVQLVRYRLSFLH